MHNVSFALTGAWRVLIASLVLGAGLPALYAMGIRALSAGVGGRTGEVVISEVGVTAAASRPVGRVLAGLCFGVVLVAVAVGIAFVVATGFGKTLSFEHLYPTIVSKH